jgi:hypothetical protein
MASRILSTPGFALVTLLALAVSANARAFIELNEIQALVHLAAYPGEQDSHSHPGHDEESSSGGMHTHSHRHAPDAPEHEHTHWDSTFFFSVATAPSLRSGEAGLAIPVFSRSAVLPMHHEKSATQHPASVFRPPIA